MEKIEEQVKSLMFDKFDISPATVNNKSKFSDDFGVDSLDFLEFLAELEKQFNINIPPEAIEKIHTVEDLTNYIESQKK